MPLRPREWDGPPCLTHGEGCRIKFPPCRVEVDPASDPDEFRCSLHGKWCNLQWSVCKRRQGYQFEWLPVHFEMFATAREWFARELAEAVGHEPGTLEFGAADAVLRPPGRDLEYVLRQFREVREDPDAWADRARSRVTAEKGTSERRACLAAIRWYAGLHRRRPAGGFFSEDLRRTREEQANAEKAPVAPVSPGWEVEVMAASRPVIRVEEARPRRRPARPRLTVTVPTLAPMVRQGDDHDDY
jgi:hypothetical protein